MIRCWERGNVSICSSAHLHQMSLYVAVKSDCLESTGGRGLIGGAADSGSPMSHVKFKEITMSPVASFTLSMLTLKWSTCRV